MRKLTKAVLIAAGVLLALAAVGVLAINLYVQSAGTQKRIEHALSSALKAPVHVTSTMVTPWSGLRASGLTVPQTPPLTGNFLEAASFTAHFDWSALLKHRLDASEVSLDEPRVEWFQTPSGRWELPRAAPALQAAPTPRASPIPAAEEAPPRPPGPVWEASVHKLVVDGASFDFWDDKGMRVLAFAGVRFDCLDPRAAGTQGQASARNISLHDKLFLSDMATDWSYQRGLLKLSSFQTAVGGGVIRGQAQVATLAKYSPFTVDVNFEGVDANQLMSQAGQSQAQVSGTLKGWLDLYGNPGKKSSINGSGHLELARGRMQVEILEALGNALRIPDLVQMDLKTAEADVRVVSGTIEVDRLELDSQNLAISAHGTVGDDGRLAIDVRLTINETIADRLPSFVVDYFKPGDATGSRYVDFKIGNTLSHPKQNLLDNISGHKIQGQMLDLFQTLFSRKHKQAEPTGPPP